MSIGERIKQARLEKGLSQRQLCEDTVTRNMLSLIESGKARPGMDTLTVFASRLGKPVSWFLEEQAVVSVQQKPVDSARRAFRRGDHQEALRLLETCSREDPVYGEEVALLTYLCLLDLSRQALSQGKLPYARSLLEQAQSGAGIYECEALAVERLCLQAQAGMDLSGEDTDRLDRAADGLLLLQAQRLSPDRAVSALEAVANRDEMWYYRRGAAAAELGQFREAAHFLHQAEERFPELCAPLLEKCYRELEDYKRAYAYACKQRK